MTADDGSEWNTRSGATIGLSCREWKLSWRGPLANNQKKKLRKDSESDVDVYTKPRSHQVLNATKTQPKQQPTVHQKNNKYQNVT